jgi:hypothetical protein
MKKILMKLKRIAIRVFGSIVIVSFIGWQLFIYFSERITGLHDIDMPSCVSIRDANYHSSIKKARMLAKALMTDCKIPGLSKHSFT